MAATHILILLATGLFTGFASGILGLGGAFIMTPVQYLVFTAMGISPDVAIKMAFGTSLMVVLPTAISGAWRHHRKGAVHWRTAIIMGSGTLVVALIGATIATHLPGEALRITFGVVLLAGGIWMLINKRWNTTEEPKCPARPLLAWAIPIGLATGIIGVGGGIVAVPILVLALKFRMHNTVATSLGIVVFSSTGGIIGYIVNGLGVAGLPAYSLGYVNLPAWLLLTVTSIGMAQVGAITAHRLSAKVLRYLFIALMFYMALRMLGVFEWLGLPL